MGRTIVKKGWTMSGSIDAVWAVFNWIIFNLSPIAILLVLGYVGWRANQKSFVGSLFAAFLAVFVMFFVERKRRPQISIVKEQKSFGCDKRNTFLRVIVKNRALRLPLNLLMD